MSYVYQGIISRTICWCSLVGSSVSFATLIISELAKMKRSELLLILSILSLHRHPVTKTLSFEERTPGERWNWDRGEYFYLWKFSEDFRSDQYLFWDPAILLVAIKVLFLYNDMRN